MYIACGFKLDVENKVLYYKDEIVADTCDKILNFYMNLSIGEDDLEQYDLTVQEKIYLEQMLADAILQKSICLEKE